MICFIDNGFDLEHLKFNIPGKIISAKDCKGSDFLPDASLDFDGHGTACAGLALAEEASPGIMGLAPNCALISTLMITNWLPVAERIARATSVQTKSP